MLIEISILEQTKQEKEDDEVDKELFQREISIYLTLKINESPQIYSKGNKRQIIKFQIAKENETHDDFTVIYKEISVPQEQSELY